MFPFIKQHEHFIMSQNLYLHDVNLGEPMDEEEIATCLREYGEGQAMRAVMALLRNRAADSDRAARTEGQGEVRAQKCGEAAAYEEAFWFVFEHAASCTGHGAQGTGSGGAVVDPDEAEHAEG